MTTSFERHHKECTCSYCRGTHAMHYGLNIPPRWWGWNSWYVIKWAPGRYVRWTMPWLRFFSAGREA